MQTKNKNRIEVTYGCDNLFRGHVYENGVHISSTLGLNTKEAAIRAAMRVTNAKETGKAEVK